MRSYVRYLNKEKGAWIEEYYLTLILRLICDEIDKAEYLEDIWKKELYYEFRFKSLGMFSSFINLRLDYFLTDENRKQWMIKYFIRTREFVDHNNLSEVLLQYHEIAKPDDVRLNVFYDSADMIIVLDWFVELLNENTNTDIDSCLP